MNWSQVESNWKQVAGSFRERFSELSNNDIDHSSGNKDQLIDMLRRKYGCTREEAELRANEWQKSLRDDENDVPTSTSGAPTY